VQVLSGYKASDRFEMTCQTCQLTWNRDNIW
jgi:hypothetical protein